ncbi:MAG: PIG-L family deacetylase [Actinomycetia bacterium]|nr:PIG-L family deacetylase [Actinomycetes bacterium]
MIQPRRVIVAFHAHPDDEALYTGGTLAALAARGHRVVLVTATAGAAGLTRPGFAPDELAARRSAELARSAKALGCARLVQLGYPDSGSAAGVAPAPGSFAARPLAEVAERLAEILRAERADLLIVYDANGGYGHRDHVRVHDAGLAAARLTGTPRVLAATVDRTAIARALRVLGWARLVPVGTATERIGSWYSARAEITHRVPVRRFLAAKRAALACHTSQTEGGRGPRTVGLLLALPKPLFRLACGVEWFVEIGGARPVRPLGDPLIPTRLAR